MDIKQLLQLAIEQKASDLHLVAGVPPTLRISGVLSPIVNESILTGEIISGYLKEIVTAEQLQKLTVNKEIDFSLAFSEKSRFRVNAYHQKGTPAVAFRQIPLEIPAIDALNLPRLLHKFTSMRQGFILVTGPTGHGKSTTLAAILNEINQTRATHIVTIEDPVEFVFRPAKSIISQREMGSDTHSWPIALRSVLREDPDVVLVGEMRDRETIASALTVAETGHLVFATLHTNSAAQTVDRIVDVFPEEQQSQVRLQLSNVLEAVFSMRLVPDLKGKLVPVYELMLGTSAVKTAVRDGKTHQIDTIIQTSSDAGMNTLEASLAALVRNGVITVETAQSYSLRPEELNRLIRK
ncbi:type IV pili twitching motility protein PilT [Candidatus Woesebacteria bacterium RIFCSPHIGHO2_01_FULL_44_10]|uniref:Type IV pili twitching motility protein PilT n=1 Tax=Candidatus Woesebacteria bacterium RIFCSPLOWO2_01_FULL_44_14 TaxID=1802525 RepID=A0A1F8BXL3_9BACT|nr:MAG: type IV pili twitching motility protein PilT [Candidatus Woesebacteria bacterium RIFCSPHIGHO2_01_FULL_44_10]OGM56449.1 MAG: type IV pili twitching motility protein PilT [Candidatus Woesebacteria bacterium RIFCSPHIGHO2_12_FULL_44_11]OGM68851.1 MAG: type IV pili twitching motility protein PilT [Candidatus Woesebacteria bacterium RIFCSPLOWO2_01_FULL_44_14]